MVPPCDGYVNEVPINRELRVKMPLFVPNSTGIRYIITATQANESTSLALTSTTETPSPHRNTSATPEHDMATAPPTKEPPLQAGVGFVKVVLAFRPVGHR